MAFPKYYLDSVLDIDPAWLQKVGRTCVLIDLDNTLLPRDTSTFSSEVREWVQSLYDAGLDVCLLSNNWHQRVFTAADELNMRLVSKAIKPLPFAFLLAVRRAGGRRKNTIMIGDQLFTDVLGSALLGIPAIMVKPLAQHDLTHTLLLRRLERLVMGERKTAALPE